jgi:hypothetical protein
VSSYLIILWTYDNVENPTRNKNRPVTGTKWKFRCSGIEIGTEEVTELSGYLSFYL